MIVTVAFFCRVFGQVSPLFSIISDNSAPDTSYPYTVFYSGNMKLRLSDCGCGANPMGGIHRAAFFIKDFERKNGPVIKVDCGGFYDPGRNNPKRRTRLLFKAFKKLGYDAVNVTYGDLKAGMEFFEFPAPEYRGLNFINANIKKKKKYAFKRYVMKDYKGLRFCITGIAACKDSDKIKRSVYTVCPPAREAEDVFIMTRSASDYYIILTDVDGETAADIVDRCPAPALVIRSDGRRDPSGTRIKNSVMLASGAYGKYVTYATFGKLFKEFGGLDFPLEAGSPGDPEFESIISAE
ncbi:MAG: hypothetical protein ACLFQK_06730 [Fibrobacterota bacterium]